MKATSDVQTGSSRKADFGSGHHVLSFSLVEQ